MAGTFFGLQIGRSGIYTQRKAMETTSHNIANAIPRAIQDKMR